MPFSCQNETRRFGLKAWPSLGILIVQAFLCLAHLFLYATLVDFWLPLSPSALLGLRVGLALLSVSFIIAALLGFRLSNWIVALLYQIAAVWFGPLDFLFVAACLCWVIDFALRIALPVAAHLHARPWIARDRKSVV